MINISQQELRELYNEYLEKGGKQQEFRDSLKQFIRKEPKKVPLRKREIVNG